MLLHAAGCNMVAVDMPGTAWLHRQEYFHWALCSLFSLCATCLMLAAAQGQEHRHGRTGEDWELSAYAASHQMSKEHAECTLALASVIVVVDPADSRPQQHLLLHRSLYGLGCHSGPGNVV